MQPIILTFFQAISEGFAHFLSCLLPLWILLIEGLMFPQMHLISHLPSLFFFGRNHCTNQLCEITEKADRDQNTLVCYTCHCDPGADLGEDKTETTGIAPESCIHVESPTK